MSGVNAETVLDALKVLVSGLEAMKQTLDEKLPELKQAITNLEEMRDKLKSDRSDADDALDRKFDK